jgi:hypothetical protein
VTPTDGNWVNVVHCFICHEIFDDFVPVDEVSSFTAMFTLVPELRQRARYYG